MADGGSASLQFLGAAGGVTGSKFLVAFGDDQVLIDCGLFQGLKELRLKNWAPVPMGMVTLKDPLLLPTWLVTGSHTVGDARLVVLYKDQSPAQPGQVTASAWDCTVSPSAGCGKRTAATAEFTPEPQPSTPATL